MNPVAVEVMPSWDDLVAEGRRVLVDHNWALGDLACQVETHYGGGDLERYARAIDVDFTSLKVYRWVASRWPKVRRLNSVSWSTHQALAALDDRFELIATVKTVADARAILKNRGTEARTPDDEVPQFEPEESTGRLDEQSVSCPNCGHRWVVGAES